MAEALGVASSVIAVVDLSAKILSLCLQYSREVKNAKDDIDRLHKEVAAFQNTTEKLKALLEEARGRELKTSQQLLSVIEDGRSRLEKLEQQLQPPTHRKVMSRFGARAFKWPFECKDVEGIIQNLGTMAEPTRARFSVILQNVDDRTTLNQLPVAHGASFDSKAEEHNPTCLPDTRKELLKEIYRWIDDPKSKTIFWLNGMAGTGKSTISRTVARSRSKRGDLGASFFFKRGEVDRGNLDKLMSTLAYHLAMSIPGATVFIKKVLDVNPAIVGKTVKEQFETLIQGPLCEAAATATIPSTVVMVIDALDECDQEADIRSLISIFSQAKIIRPQLRVFLTSRPELPIRLGFSEVQGCYQALVVHEIPVQIVEHDIVVFLNDEFKKIRHDFNMTVGDERKLPPDWPGGQTVESLAQMAVPLFIFAATICRFVGDSRRRNPQSRLQTVLGHGRRGRGSQLDQTYAPILHSQTISLPREEREEIIRDFRVIVGSIVTLASPLSVIALSRLIDVPIEVVGERLDALHSVLSIPSEATLPVRLFHLSFRDYLMTNGSEFQVDEKHTHQSLGKHCLRAMSGGLCENICSLSSPGMRRSAVDFGQLEKRMPSELQYACMHWAYHQTSGDTELSDDNDVYGFLTTHFLHWVEAMSLLGRVKECLDALKSLARWLEVASGSNDATIRIWNAETGKCERELKGHSDNVNSVVLSHDSKKLASASDDKTIRIWDTETGECERVLEGHSNCISSVVFSHNSKKLASGSRDKTIRIWDAETGECERELKGHSEGVSSVVFSHDSKKLASGSFGKTIRIWDTETGKCNQVLKGHSDYVISVVFSHDSTRVASGSNDATIRIWNAETGKCERELKGHSDDVNSVVFSHDLKKVVSASDDAMIRIWDAETGECERELKGHSDDVKSMVFSHDSTRVASASDDATIRIWDTEMGECNQVPEGHGDRVTSVVFSHDSKKLASASHDTTIRIWDAETGECEQELKGHSKGVRFVVFSHDSKKLASGSFGKTIRIWDAETGKCNQVLEGHSNWVSSVVFSHDSKKLASGSFGKTIRIWDAETGKCNQVLEGHSNWVSSMVFSHDSKKLASISSDAIIRIWNAETGKCERELKGHSSWVMLVVYSHDSKKLVSISNDKTIRIWNAETGECEDVILLDGYADTLSFTSDQRGIVTNRGVFAPSNGSQSRVGFAMPWQCLGAPTIACTGSTWITAAGKDLLWLPPEYRGGKAAVSGSTFVIGCPSGRVVFLGISIADVEKWTGT
ncbi:heterokaryon incompatibility protein het-E-1 [Fusarium globosum]|uniref:Heterokaryon incompatibility protein het-E-1 n=1 Tax=Fusarium globosum TaxID=78864 RepID=A0A8H5XN74_9HYPO|nr:heterokaryon incompatibility protein het-E-1 [Fusarium globosum]